MPNMYANKFLLVLFSCNNFYTWMNFVKFGMENERKDEKREEGR